MQEEYHNKENKLYMRFVDMEKPFDWVRLIWFDSGSQVGIVVIIRTSHLYDPGSNPGLGMWAEFCWSQSDFEGFSPGTPVFLPQPKINSQLIPSAVVLCSEVVDGL